MEDLNGGQNRGVIDRYGVPGENDSVERIHGMCASLDTSHTIKHL